VRAVWTAVHDARDAAITFLRRRHDAKQEVRGFEVDRAARAVLEKAGYGAQVFHRTGHSIDRDLHGSGPHLDDFETHDDRVLLPGVGFSIEPGVYFTGDFGVRSEVNGYWSANGLVVTPAERQETLITS
jgi:Xaa-Pro aminopeptidase